jgi:hypothetical protein
VKLKSVLSVAAILAIALSSELLGNPGLSETTYKPPKRPAPQRTSLGGGRPLEVGCADSNQEIKQIVPLIPNYLNIPESVEENSKTYYDLTISEYPTLWVYLPKSDAQMGELVLRIFTEDEQGRKIDKSILRRQFPLPNQAGVVSLDLADAGIEPLAPNTFYWYSISILCDPLDQSENGKTEKAFLERVTPSTAFGQQIFNALPTALPRLYPQGDDNGGFWYDTISSLIDLRQLQPNNSDLETQWQDLLESVGLLELAEQPLLDCCEFEQQDTPQP